MREQNLDRYFVSRIRSTGALVRKVIFPAHVRAPDRIVMSKEGKLIWVELKAPGRKPTKLQELEHQRLRALGQRVEVIDSFEQIHKLAGELCD